VKWNYMQDCLVFDKFPILVKSSDATKCNMVGIASRLYDPLEYESLVTIPFEMFFRDLHVSKMG